MKFNVRQRKVIYAEEPKILCLACASSGKTATLTERVRVLVKEKNVSPEKIVAISFTNMAADEMRRRLGDVSNGMFIGTIHSYANKICLENNIPTQQYIEEEDFDRILKKALTLPRHKYPKVEHLLIDECQDLCPIEYEFIQKIPTNNIFFCGDDRQNIYGFKNATDRFLKDMYNDPEYKKYYLVDNYRNAPNIIEFADQIIKTGLSPKSVPVKVKNGDIVEESFAEALEELKEIQNYGNWFILTRSNKELAAAQDILNENDIPNVSFKKGELENNDQLDELMNSDKVKVLTIHQAKGCERNNVIVIGAKKYNEEERKIAYVAATRAKNALYWCPTIVSRKKKQDVIRVTSKDFDNMIEF